MLRFTQHNRCATEDAEAIASSVLKNVEEIFGKLHKPGMKAISLEKIDQAVKERMNSMFHQNNKSQNTD